MSLSQVRSYINTRMATIAPSLSEWKDSFNAENIPTTLLNSRYHLLIGGGPSTPKQDRSIEDTQEVTLTIFRNGFSDVPSAVDSLMDTAHNIRMDLINSKNIDLFDCDILDVVVSSITPSEIDDTNDNTIKVEIALSFNLTFLT